MMSWLIGAKCPVEPARQAWLERGLNWLGTEFGAERMLERPVILPTTEFFPEECDGTEETAGRIFDRVCEYMDVSRDRVYLDFYANERDNLPGYLREGRSSGAAGLYQDENIGRAVIGIDESKLGDPVSLVATMAHELGHVHLLGDGRISPEIPDHEPLTDLLTVLFGLGIFSANSVITESNWSEGQHSGWSIGKQGYLTGPEYGYALALMEHARDNPKPEWLSKLRLDVRSPMKQGLRFLQSQGTKPFPQEASLLPDDDGDEVPWTRPMEQRRHDEDDDLPPWKR